MAPTTGTRSHPFAATLTIEEMIDQPDLRVWIQHICAQPQYSTSSPEELRLADYFIDEKFEHAVKPVKPFTVTAPPPTPSPAEPQPKEAATPSESATINLIHGGLLQSWNRALLEAEKLIEEQVREEVQDEFNEKLAVLKRGLEAERELAFKMRSERLKEALFRQLNEAREKLRQEFADNLEKRVREEKSALEATLRAEYDGKIQEVSIAKSKESVTTPQEDTPKVQESVTTPQEDTPKVDTTEVPVTPEVTKAATEICSGASETMLPQVDSPESQETQSTEPGSPTDSIKTSSLFGEGDGSVTSEPAAENVIPEPDVSSLAVTKIPSPEPAKPLNPVPAPEPSKAPTQPFMSTKGATASPFQSLGGFSGPSVFKRSGSSSFLSAFQPSPLVGSFTATSSTNPFPLPSLPAGFRPASTWSQPSTSGSTGGFKRARDSEDSDGDAEKKKPRFGDA